MQRERPSIAAMAAAVLLSQTKTKEMSLRLLEACQQVNVYGSVWTDEMWDEIHHASKLGIPMMTDQKTIGRTPPRRSGRKER